MWIFLKHFSGVNVYWLDILIMCLHGMHPNEIRQEPNNDTTIEVI
jgi:hypothetical protein